MKTQSVEVLNEADRQQRIIDWMLFKQEQGLLLRYIEGSIWNVGDPIWVRPNRVSFALRGAQFIRPMFELMGWDEFHLHHNDMVYFHMRCMDCEVGWEGDEPCFVCGNPGRDDLFRFKFTTDASDGPFSIDRNAQAAVAMWERMNVNHEMSFDFRIPVIDPEVRDFSEGPFSMGENVRTILIRSQISSDELRRRQGFRSWVTEDVEITPRTPETVIVNEIEIPAQLDLHTTPQYTHDLGDNIHITADLGTVRRQIEERGWPSSRPVWMR